MAKKGGLSSIKINSPYILCLLVALLCSIDYVQLGKFLLIIAGVVILFGMIAFNLLDKKQKHKIATLEEIDAMTGVEFEEYLQQFFEAAGYSTVMTSTPNEQDTDLILKKEQFTYVVQAKHYNGVKVGIQAVQEIISSKFYHDALIGVLITNNYCTQNAKRLAENNNILLWDRDVLGEFSLEEAKDLLPLPTSVPLTTD